MLSSLGFSFLPSHEIYSKNVNLSLVIRQSKAHNRFLHTLMLRGGDERGGKFCACSRFMDKNGRKIETFLSIQYIAQNAKWEMKRKNSFSLSPEERLQCLPVTLNLFFALLLTLLCHLPDYKALFIVISQLQNWWKFLEIQSCIDHRRSSSNNMSNLLGWRWHVFGALNKFIVHHFFRSLMSSISMASCKSFHRNLSFWLWLLLFISISIFIPANPSSHPLFNWQKIMHPSSLHFNGTFQFRNFPLVVVFL